MNFGVTCRAWAPELLCQHSDILLYLAPSAALALVIRVLAATHPAFFLFTAAGTMCHELAHCVLGFVTGASPAALTIIPRRKGQHWELGSVTLRRVRWYNAAPTALAPLLILVIPFAVAWWRTSTPHWRFEIIDLGIAFALAPQFLSFWPSAIDWRTAARSWPYLGMIIPIIWLYLGRPLP